LIKESIYSEDQMIDELSINANRFKATLNCLYSINKWILGMGTKSIVIGPDNLKEEIKSVVEEMLQQYKKSSLINESM
jgi:predicted DNA-binding transcriptional regulator YafY